MRIHQISSAKYFHGSYDLLDVGTILTPEKGNFMKTFDEYEMDSHFVLEKFKPKGYLSRNRCVFMTTNPDDIEAAGGATRYIYEVKPLGPVEMHDLSWMSEIDTITSESFENGTQDHAETREKIKKAAMSYWYGFNNAGKSPIWEYLTTSAEIIKRL